MFGILQYIDTENEGSCFCYKTRKFSLDEYLSDTVSENSDQNIIPDNQKGVFAEDDEERVNTVRIPDRLIRNNKSPWFSYFLDGSRHVYKVDDIAIGNKIYPIVAGQLIVGCCHRIDRDTFKKESIVSRIILALPKSFYTGRHKESDYARLYCEKMNACLKEKNTFFKTHNIQVDKIVFYPIDGNGVDELDSNKYRNSGIVRIQNEMTDEEQIMVAQLCKQKKLNDDNWLIKDGSLQYSHNHSNMDINDFNAMRANYQRVLGVSKSFNPDLLKNFEGKKMAHIIANLKPFERTKAYVYHSPMSENQTFAIWYLRLRKEENFRETRFSDIIKCELVLEDEKQKIPSSDIDSISANLIQEAYPVCYGKDSRWGNHLYPVFLTESFCKSNYISNHIFLNLF